MEELEREVGTERPELPHIVDVVEVAGEDAACRICGRRPLHPIHQDPRLFEQAAEAPRRELGS